VNIKSEALNTFFLFKKLLSVEIYYNRIKRMNTEYTCLRRIMNKRMNTEYTCLRRIMNKRMNTEYACEENYE